MLAGSPAIDAGDPAFPSLPVALYHFDDATGVATAHDSIGGHDGTYHGDPLLGSTGAPVDSGSAISFDGVDDHVLVPRMVADDFSFSLWIKTSLSPLLIDRLGLIDGNAEESNNDFGLSYVNGRISLRVGIAGPATSVQINDGNWHHVAATRSGATGVIRLYVDGVGRGSGSGPTGTMDAASMLSIGQLANGTGRFEGSIDEVAIYDRVLSLSEAQLHATTGTPLWDQRGAPHLRVLDGDEPDDIVIDIGAYEASSARRTRSSSIRSRMRVTVTIPRVISRCGRQSSWRMRIRGRTRSNLIRRCGQRGRDDRAHEGELAITDSVTITGAGADC